ncbi:TetR/AcrR family transcriptional regulator [Microbacterium sp. BWT-B31]|uniref:TetR/AcrR family transcriptional regulator n=1 Tax=Microbacterium sp. BWT-B31 TaxID=3232072 RepID=UPI003527E736
MTTARAHFEANGYRHSTTREIAAAGNFSEVLIFRHFGTKAALFQASVVEQLSAEIADLAASYDENQPSKEFFFRMAEFMKIHRDSLLCVLSASTFNAELQQIADGQPRPITPLITALEDVTSRDAERHGIKGLDIPIVTAITTVALMGPVLFDQWLFGESIDEIDFDRFVDQTWRYLTFGSARPVTEDIDA